MIAVEVVGERYEEIVEQLGRDTIEAVLESIDPPYQEDEGANGNV